MDCITNIGGGQHETDRTNKWKAQVAVEADAWASGATALGPSFRVASLRGFGVARGLSLDHLIRPQPERVGVRPDSPFRMKVSQHPEFGWRTSIPRTVGVSGPPHRERGQQRPYHENDGRDVNRPKVRHPIVLEGSGVVIGQR